MCDMRAKMWWCLGIVTAILTVSVRLEAKKEERVSGPSAWEIVRSAVVAFADMLKTRLDMGRLKDPAMGKYLEVRGNYDAATRGAGGKWLAMKSEGVKDVLTWINNTKHAAMG